MRDWRPDHLFWAALTGAALAVVGFVTSVPVLAGVGVAGCLGAGLVFEWQRRSLHGVTYERSLGRHRALFSERVPLTVTIENQKALPLTWLRVEDTVSSPLTVTGGTLARAAQTGRRPELVTLLSVLPFQRVARHMTVVCDRRGLHPRPGPGGHRRPLRLPIARAADGRYRGAAGPAQDLRRGPRSAGLPSGARPGAVPGPAPSRSEPSGRFAEYQAGDPLRHVDWRGTARRGRPMVRVFEPTATPRVVLVLDTRWRVLSGELDEFEFAVALTASLTLESGSPQGRRGARSTGTVDGRPVGIAPSTAPDAPGLILDALARLSPFGRRTRRRWPTPSTARPGPGRAWCW